MPTIVNHNISLVYDSITDLINANDGVVKPGMVVQTLGYYNKGDCSSGIFYVDTELNQNEIVDNGIIITTHNTLLLEELERKYMYIIYIDFKGNKEIRCVDDYKKRTQKTNNLRDKYLRGDYGGVPNVGYIDFEDIIGQD